MGWKVHRLTMTQWPNWTKCGLYFNIVSPAVHTLLPSLLLSSWSSTKSTADLIIGPILLLFSCRGTENSQMVPNQEKMEGDQPVQSHSHTQQPLQSKTCVQEHCPGETGLSSSVSHIHEMSLVSTTTFQSPKLLIWCGFIWKKQCS